MSDAEVSDAEEFDRSDDEHSLDIIQLPSVLRPDGLLTYNFSVRDRNPLPPRVIENILLRDSDFVVPPLIAPAIHYDQNLTPAHQYLGRGLQETTGRIIFEKGVICTIPVIFLKLNLIPGQILPMIARSPSVQQLLKHAISKNRVFGVSYALNFMEPTFGTIAQIYEHSPDIETAELIQIKAMGHERFRILRTEPFPRCSGSEISLAEIKILGDVTLTNPFNSLCLHPKKRNPSHKEMCRKRDMWQTQWPDWVYKQFDVHQLAERVSKKINKLYNKDIKISDDPRSLSFQVIKLGIFRPEQVNCLLGIESTNLRLQFALQYWDENQSMQTFLCSRSGCGLTICSMSNVFTMSPDGPLGTYCNTFGQVHEMITVTELDEEIDVLSVGQPSTECCWFPGYKWLIILCPNCHRHLGWRYEADTDRSLVPRLFYGLCMLSITSIKNFLPPDDNPRDFGNREDERLLRF